MQAMDNVFVPTKEYPFPKKRSKGETFARKFNYEWLERYAIRPTQLYLNGCFVFSLLLRQRESLRLGDVFNEHDEHRYTIYLHYANRSFGHGHWLVSER